MPQVKVTGKVTDQKGDPLPGVNVLVKGTTTGTISATDGKYSIETEIQNPTLIFSFIGYIQQVLVSDGKTQVDVDLVCDIQGGAYDQSTRRWAKPAGMPFLLITYTFDHADHYFYNSGDD